jgi:hypothetical protein
MDQTVPSLLTVVASDSVAILDRKIGRQACRRLPRRYRSSQ